MRWYLYSSYHAAGIIAEYVSIIPLEGEAPVTALPSLAGYDDAMAWLDAESQAIEESVRISHEYGCDDIAWRLPIATLAWNARADHRPGWTQMIDTALSSAERCADLRGKAQILRIMGLNHNDGATAVRLLLEAAQLCREVDDPRGLAAAYNNLGVVYGRMEDYESAANALDQALEIHKRNGSYSSLLRTMNNLGKALRGLGEHDRALEILAEVLTARRQAGDERGTASVLNTIGETLIALKRYDEAIERLLESHALHQSFQLYPHNLSTILMLGDALSIIGKAAQAHELWQAGLSISEGFEAAEADHFRGRLRDSRVDVAQRTIPGMMA
jgi:tetratricopeptide (TPR) repeat protein